MCSRRPLGRSARVVLLACAAAAVCAPAALAAPARFHRDRTPLPAVLRGASQAGGVHAAGGTGGALARTVVGLAIVLAVVFGVYWLLRAYARGRRSESDGRMRILATTALAPNRALHLVQVGDGLVLIGSAEHGVTRIRTYTEDESRLLRAQLDAAHDPLRPIAGGTRPAVQWGGLIDELRRRTARR